MKKKILFIDDDDKSLSILKIMLRSYDDKWHMDFVNNMADAQHMLNDNDPDVVLASNTLTPLSGVDVLEFIKKNNPHTPVVIISANLSCETAVNYIKLGAINYICKPIEFDELIKTLETVLDDTYSCVQKTGFLNISNAQSSMRNIDGFNIIKTIDEGSMGIIFLAEKLINDTPTEVALKVIKLHQNINNEDQMVRWKRFVREAEIADSLNHPNIIKLISYGIDKGQEIPYIAMEYIDGQSLKNLLLNEQNPVIDLNQKINILKQSAAGLGAIHEQDILHRDVKPANFLIDKNLQVKLTDFGIARLPDSNLTRSCILVGSPAYFSPEVLLSPKIDHRSDIFSLGVVAFELFLNKRPFDAADFISLSRIIRTKKPEMTSDDKRKLPFELQCIILKMLEKNPKNRYQNTSAIVSDLEALLSKSVRVNSGTDT